MRNVPSSSKLLTIVIKQLEPSGAPTFERLQAAIVVAAQRMPMVRNVGLVPDRHNLEELIKQTKDLGLIFDFGGKYMVTEKGRNYLNGIG